MAFLATVLTFSAFHLTAAPAASNPVKLKGDIVASGLLDVQLTNLMQQPTRVLLESYSGVAYFQDYVKGHNGYRKLLNLSNIPEGTYLLKVQQGEAIITMVVKHEAAGRFLVSDAVKS